MSRATAIAHRLAPLLLALPLAACEPDECTLSMGLGGEFDVIWEWRYPGTECFVTPAATAIDAAGFKLDNELGNSLTVSSANPLAAGTSFVDVTYTAGYIDSWTTDGSGTGCQLIVTNYEFVDWVRNDHYRMSGQLVCVDPLINPDDGSEVWLSNVTFSLYATEQYAY